MTNPFGGQTRPAPGLPQLPTPPTGWPVGSYATYEEAQRAVDHLADSDFPVADVTIVGVDLMLVERVIARLTWGRVLASGAAQGAWLGLFVGLLLFMFSPDGNFLPIVVGLVSGAVFFMAFAAVSYSASKGRRDFQSASQMVAGRYDVLCEPRNAERAREMLAKLAMGSPGGGF
ncbi:magnesium transporter [Pseudonocardia sp. EV170527-09]|uniref:general stress protein n=1 Tax=unclassified Pseudonocardia TaxID=2619320 RepID=UPI0006CB2047|nr:MULTISPECIES: general stress protein [unclassified Pseudonocardia]ALE85171.1 membrane protein [Pseudonocardia sp. HH130629-09]KAA1013935.1 magnesium transporter [Pseudonocardia sp. EV170527-09]